MLKSIAEVAPELSAFVNDLDLRLSQPQQRHVKQIADGLITIEGDKSLSNLYRHFVGDPLLSSNIGTIMPSTCSGKFVSLPCSQLTFLKCLSSSRVLLN